MDQLQKQQQNELAEQDARRNAARDRDGGAQQGLPDAQDGDVPLFKTQDAVKSQIFLPPLHNEAVGVQQEHRGKQRHNAAARNIMACRVLAPRTV